VVLEKQKNESSRSFEFLHCNGYCSADPSRSGMTWGLIPPLAGLYPLSFREKSLDFTLFICFSRFIARPRVSWISADTNFQGPAKRLVVLLPV